MSAVSDADEEVTVTLPRGEFRALVASANQVGQLMGVVGDVDGAILVTYIATKVVQQIDPEWDAAHPLPDEAIATAEKLMAEDRARRRG